MEASFKCVAGTWENRAGKDQRNHCRLNPLSILTSRISCEYQAQEPPIDHNNYSCSDREGNVHLTFMNGLTP